MTTYPLAFPRHGGQIRSAQIVKIFRECGLDVTTIGVADAAAYGGEDLGPNDIVFPIDSRCRLYRGSNVPYASDYLSGVYAASDETAYKRILAAIPKDVKVLVIEQPWMYPVAQRLRADRSIDLLIYDAQNHETSLKASILKRYHPELCLDLLELINAREREACSEADFVFAVSQSDRESLAGYRDGEILLAPNGVEPWRATVGDYKRWKSTIEKDVDRFALYVASAHPPNFLHFSDVFANAFGFLAPDEAICVAGGASAQIEKSLSGQPNEALSRSRMRFLGVLSDRDLAAVKQLAHAFVLPVIEGSGSNLKTAEALLSGAWVIGTPTAFRGFENFTALPNVVVAEPGKTFCDALRNCLGCPVPPLTESEGQSLEAITWRKTLMRMVDVVLHGEA